MLRQKDEAGRLDLDAYPHSFEHRTLFADTDAFRHINNGAIARYFEEGRADINRQVFGDEVMTNPPGQLQLLFAANYIEYLAQLHYPDQVTIATAIGQVGKSSWQVLQAGFTGGNCFALATATLVKANTGMPSPLTEQERQKLHAFDFEPHALEDQLLIHKPGASSA